MSEGHCLKTAKITKTAKNSEFRCPHINKSNNMSEGHCLKTAKIKKTTKTAKITKTANNSKIRCPPKKGWKQQVYRA